jgi:hypothetical protein
MSQFNTHLQFHDGRIVDIHFSNVEMPRVMVGLGRFMEMLVHSYDMMGNMRVVPYMAQQWHKKTGAPPSPIHSIGGVPWPNLELLSCRDAVHLISLGKTGTKL